MAKNHRFPRYLVKFPKVKPTSGEKVDNFEEYVPVELFTKPKAVPVEHGYRADSERNTQGPLPVQITVTEGLMARLEPLAYKGELDDDEIECVEIALKDGKAVKTWEQELKDCVISVASETMIIIESYVEFETKKYTDGSETSEFGFNFRDQQVTVS